MSRVYCSDAARLRGDDNIATAARVDVWILVELPITWGVEPIVDAAIPDPVRAALKHASSTIHRSRVVFIRKRVDCVGPTRVYIVRTNAGITTLDLPSLDDVATVDFIALAERVEPSTRPLVLVCTHGQHDSCCGRRGYPLYDALRQREELDVWQCSHIGGDRFAANAVILPWGIYYGPVEPRDAGALADTLLREELYLPAYRGRSSLSRPVQAAETFVRRSLNLLERDALRLVKRETLVDGRMRVCLRDTNGATHDVTIEHYLATDGARLTCAAREEAPIRQFRLVDYRVV